MSYLNILRPPDLVRIQTGDGWLTPIPDRSSAWQARDVGIVTKLGNAELIILLSSTRTPVSRVHLRWQESIPRGTRILNDHWERGYGDLEWRGLVPERVLPWYFLTYDGSLANGYGVKTGARSMCFWQVDSSGVSLWLDVRSGGTGVLLKGRVLEAAAIVSRKGKEDESPFQAATAFCRQLCDQPVLPAQPVYGGNNWYYAYGHSSHDEILRDSELIASLAPSGDVRPYMVVDDGWQICHSRVCNGGPWHSGNYLFPDMPGLAEEMINLGVRPGIWIRPLKTDEKVPDTWILPNRRFNRPDSEQYLDPSLPEVLEHISEDISRLVSWGFRLIKHDFSTYDLFGRWGYQMGPHLTPGGWSLADRSKTTAETILDLYQAVRDAAGEALVLGCNTIGHLAAGIFPLQRTGDDTSGREWERTRKYGINTLGFRMPQHGTFFAADADCVALTHAVPWEMNRQWLQLLAASGTPLFVSAAPAAVGREQKAALREAFQLAASQLPIGEPLDWLDSTCPRLWRLNGETRQFNWYERTGPDLRL